MVRALESSSKPEPSRRPYTHTVRCSLDSAIVILLLWGLQLLNKSFQFNLKEYFKKRRYSFKRIVGVIVVLCTLLVLILKGNRQLLTQDIVYVSSDAAGQIAELRTINADGTDLARITSQHLLHSSNTSPTVWNWLQRFSPHVHLSSAEVKPSWSPDGEKLAYLEVAPHGTYRIVIVEPDGGRIILKHERGILATAPVWSRDGQYVGTLSNEQDLLIFEVNSGQVLNIIEIDGNLSEFDWSPDTDVIVGFVDLRPTSQSKQIVLIEPFSGAVFEHSRQDLVEGRGECCLSWSPDGDLFAYISFSITETTLNVIDFQSSKLVGQHNIPLGFCLDWAPNSRELSALGKVEGTSYSDYDIFKLDISTGELVRLTKGMGVDYMLSCPQWSPKGDWILFVASGVSSAELFKVSSNGETLVQLTDNSLMEAQATWHPIED